MRLDGATQTLFWDDESKPREPPDQWRHKQLRVRQCPSHAWVSKSGCSVTVFLADVQILED